MLSPVQAFMPSIVSSGVFSTRRTDKAISSDNPIVSCMNLNIAGGQTLNAAKGVAEMARDSSHNVISKDILSAEKSIKELSKGDKILKGCGKVIGFTADHINPIICATSGIKVLTTKENKKDVALEEGLGLGAMFAAERSAKAFLGMPKNYKFDNNMKVINDDLFRVKDGKTELIASKGQYKISDNKVTVTKDGLYKSNPFLNKQSQALKDYCEVTKVCNKSLKFVPSVLKGVGFVCASVGGYALGAKIANNLIGNKG